jgi:hypothetical protein
MKMAKDDFRALRMAVLRVAGASIASIYRDAGKSHARYRWDCLWRSGFDTRPLHDYLNDDHIDTALRAILGADWS